MPNNRPDVSWDTSDYETKIGENFPQDASPTAVRVMMAESQGNPFAKNKNKNGTYDHGLFQINDVNVPKLQKAGLIASKDDLYDPDTNIKAAAYLQKEKGDFRDWNSSKDKWGQEAAQPDPWLQQPGKAKINDKNVEWGPKIDEAKVDWNKAENETFVGRAKNFVSDYYKWLQSPVEVHSFSDFVNNLPKNISATAVGIPASMYQAAKGITDPLIKAVFHSDKAVEHLSELPENIGDTLHGFATGIGEPLGMYGYQPFIDRWKNDPVGSTFSILMMKQGLEGGKPVTAADAMKQTIALNEKAMAGTDSNTRLFNNIAKEKLAKGDEAGAAEALDKAMSDDELKNSIAQKFMKASEKKDTASPHDIVDIFDEAAGFTGKIEERMKAKSALDKMGLMDEMRQRAIDKIMPDSLEETLSRKAMKADAEIDKYFPKEEADVIQTKVDAGEEVSMVEQDRADLINLINNNRSREVSQTWNTLLDKQSAKAQSPVQFEQLKQALAAAEKDGQIKPEYVRFWEDAITAKEKSASSSMQAELLKKELKGLEESGKVETPEYAQAWEQMLGKQEQARQSSLQYEQLKSSLKEQEVGNEKRTDVKQTGKGSGVEGDKLINDKNEQKVSGSNTPAQEKQVAGRKEEPSGERQGIREPEQGGKEAQGKGQVAEPKTGEPLTVGAPQAFSKQDIHNSRMDAIAVSKGARGKLSDTAVRALAEMHPDLAPKILKTLEGQKEKVGTKTVEAPVAKSEPIAKSKPFNIQDFVSQKLPPDKMAEKISKGFEESERAKNDSRIEEIKKQLGERARGHLFGGMDTESMKLAVELGYRYMKKGIYEFKDFVSEFKKQFGDDVVNSMGDGLHKIYEKAKTRFDREQAWVKAMPTPSFFKKVLHEFSSSTQTLEAYKGPHEDVVHNVANILTEGAQIPKNMWVVEKFGELDKIMEGIRIDPTAGSIGRKGLESNKLGKEVFNILDKFDDPKQASGFSPRAISIATDLRKWMDDVLKEMQASGVTDKRGKVIQRLDAYIHHMAEESNIAGDVKQYINEALHGQADEMAQVSGTSDIYGFSKPTPRFGPAEKRLGKLEQYETNPLTVMKRYTLAASRILFDKPAIEAARLQIEKLPDGYWKKYAEDTVKNYMPISDGVASIMHHGLARTGARSVLWGSTGLQTLHIGRILTQVMPEMGMARTLKATAEVLIDPIRSGQIYKETKAAGLLQQATIPIRFKSGMEVLDVMGNYWDFGNTVAKMVAYRASMRQVLRENPGISHEAAMVKAAKEATRVEGIPNPSTRVPAFAKLEKIPFPTVQFKYWVQKYFELGGRAVAAAAKDPSMQNLGKVGRYIAGGMMAEEITRRTGAKIFHLSPYILQIGAPVISLGKNIATTLMSDSKTPEEKLEYTFKKIGQFVTPGGESLPREVKAFPTALHK